MSNCFEFHVVCEIVPPERMPPASAECDAGRLGLAMGIVFSGMYSTYSCNLGFWPYELGRVFLRLPDNLVNVLPELRCVGFSRIVSPSSGVSVRIWAYTLIALLYRQSDPSNTKKELHKHIYIYNGEILYICI